MRVSFVSFCRVVSPGYTILASTWGLQPSTTPCSSIPWLGECYKFWIIRLFISSSLGLTLLSCSFTPMLDGPWWTMRLVLIGRNTPCIMIGDILGMLNSWGLKPTCWLQAKEHIPFEAYPCRLYLFLIKEYWNLHMNHTVCRPPSRPYQQYEDVKHISQTDFRSSIPLSLSFDNSYSSSYGAMDGQRRSNSL